MYSGSGFNDWEIGDITVIINNGTYHLFHLIIPNHDYIAHATSKDGISWKRVKNALFVGHPGEWDDDMLWTMHVCESNGKFEMYYTGLQRRDRGVISRIGYAESDNLIDWDKSNGSVFPIAPKGVYYENEKTNPRTWLSFRDPFKFEYKGEIFLLFDARTVLGPVSRRGCVGLVRLKDDAAELLPPLVYPGVYDDVECPCVFELNGKFYVLGSIREDIMVRYWYADEFLGTYSSFHDDFLLPKGNYAARIVYDGEHLLVYNFFFVHGRADALRVLPPPKEITADDSGRLVLKTYYRWEQKITRCYEQQDMQAPTALFGNASASLASENGCWRCKTDTGFELFRIHKPSPSFIWEGELSLEGNGKMGLVTDIDHDGNGYFISLDIFYGFANIRAWGFNPQNARHNFVFTDLQSAFFKSSGATIQFRLIRYGHYIELSINDNIVLTLIDYTYVGDGIGIYVASSAVSLRHCRIKNLPQPEEEYASQEEARRIETGN